MAKIVEDRELLAIACIVGTLEELEPEQAKRVLHYVGVRYGMVDAKPPGPTLPEKQRCNAVPLGMGQAKGGE